jgi:uncharacterized RDD family membrane protein YckC
MKCPKCGYLGFETTDRCRNCQYDFSLAPFSSDPELALQSADRNVEHGTDFDLPAIKRQTDSLNSAALDLDRLFGGEESAPQRAEPSDALPFDDAPIVPPPAARPPLSVRRATPEVPRHRPRTTRPIKPEPLRLEAEGEPAAATAGGGDIDDTVASLMEAPSLGTRVGAGAIDAALIIALDAAILYLTLRVTGLSNSLEDVRVLPPIPFVGFLALLAFMYVALFTVAGGQTIGKMVMSLRVIGDDGRPIDAQGGMLRAAGCMLVPITLGLSYVPVLVTSDHRALHDRLAGTRVVRE